MNSGKNKILHGARTKTGGEGIKWEKERENKQRKQVRYVRKKEGKNKRCNVHISFLL